MYCFAIVVAEDRLIVVPILLCCFALPCLVAIAVIVVGACLSVVDPILLVVCCAGLRGTPGGEKENEKGNEKENEEEMVIKEGFLFNEMIKYEI